MVWVFAQISSLQGMSLKAQTFLLQEVGWKARNLLLHLMGLERQNFLTSQIGLGDHGTPHQSSRPYLHKKWTEGFQNPVSRMVRLQQFTHKPRTKPQLICTFITFIMCVGNWRHGSNLGLDIGLVLVLVNMCILCLWGVFL